MKTDTESDTEYEEEKVFDEPPKKPEETHYVENVVEELGQVNVIIPPPLSNFRPST